MCSPGGLHRATVGAAIVHRHTDDCTHANTHCSARHSTVQTILHSSRNKTADHSIDWCSQIVVRDVRLCCVLCCFPFLFRIFTLQFCRCFVSALSLSVEYMWTKVTAPTLRSVSVSSGCRRLSSLPPPRTLPQRRVVVTGRGVVSPLGCDQHYVWQRLLRGDSGLQVTAPSYASFFSASLSFCRALFASLRLFVSSSPCLCLPISPRLFASLLLSSPLFSSLCLPCGHSVVLLPLPNPTLS